jgi:hypothetical protein
LVVGIITSPNWSILAAEEGFNVVVKACLERADTPSERNPASLASLKARRTRHQLYDTGKSSNGTGTDT